MRCLTNSSPYEVNMLTEEVKIEDMRSWYQPKLIEINAFYYNAMKWIFSLDKSESDISKEIMETGVEQSSVCDNNKDEPSQYAAAGLVDQEDQDQAPVCHPQHQPVSVQKQREQRYWLRLMC